MILFFKKTALSATLLLMIINCSQKESGLASKPEKYAKPDYTILESDSVHSPLQFTEITKATGINFVHKNGAFGKKWMPETIGSGAGFFDYNDDGLVDAGDLLIGYRILQGRITATTEQLLRGDVAPLVGGSPAPDGAITLGDIGVLIRKIQGLVSFP